MGGGVAGVGIGEGGVGGATADDGVMVVFSTRDLGLEDLVELGGEVGISRDVEGDFVSIGDPVEVAPDFATKKGGGLLVFGKSSQGGDGGGEDGEVRGMLVGGVVGINGVRVS